ncbi:TPA: hypothetical protein ACY37W_002393 [Pasteurella multocida]|nr:hypothetical protein E0Z11_10025 [Pasteurella multocida subsp. multocida]
MGSYVDLTDKYDRADGFSGGGGWKEYDSKDREARTNDREYISTRDRMNNHLSRHGSDKDYTRSFNDYSRSSISSLARTTRGNLAGNSQSNPKSTTALTGQKVDDGLLASSSLKNRADPRAFNDHHSQAAREFQDKYGFTDSSELEGFKKDTYKHRDVAGWDSNTASTVDVDVNKSFLNTGHSFADKGKKEQDRHITSYLDNIDQKVADKRVGDYTPDEYRKGFIKGEVARVGNINREHLISGLASVAGTPLSNKAANTAFKALKGGDRGILGAMAAGVGTQGAISSGAEKLSHLGNNPSSDTSELEKVSFKHGYDDMHKNLDSRRSFVGDVLHNGAVMMTGVATQNPFTATVIDMGVNILRDDHNLTEYLSRHQHIPEYKNLLDERKLQKQKAEQVMAEKKRYKSNKDAGILQKMSNSLKPSTSKNTTSQLPYYAIPAIQNLWNNIKVK